MKVLVLGVSGMLGNAVFKVLTDRYETWGSLRSSAALSYFTNEQQGRIISGVDVLEHDQMVELLSRVRPDVIVNCVGLVKQLSSVDDPLVALPVNALFPHRLARLADLIGARVIQIGTDCVFSGSKGMYCESDVSDAYDLYGKSKYIGELHDYLHCVTLRTSIIGHELNSNHSLIDWFLSQEGEVKGFSKAIFSGLPTAELARVIAEYVIPNSSLNGLYHVSAEPINKYHLLKLVAEVYEKNISIIPDDKLKIDRSLDSSRFRDITGYQPPEWADLIRYMHTMRE